MTLVNGVPKIEFPLPENHVFSIRKEKVKTRINTETFEELEPTDKFHAQEFNEQPTETDFMRSNRV